jgi:hypothetical protein
MEYLNLIASLAAAFSALAAIYAILEMQRQRRSGYLPTLLVEDIEIEVRWDSKEVIRLYKKLVRYWLSAPCFRTASSAAKILGSSNRTRRRDFLRMDGVVNLRETYGPPSHA